MEQLGNAHVSVETHLLRSCCREAERADIVALGLDQLRAALSESFHAHLIALAEEIRNSSRFLRDLADRSQVHIARVPIVANYLNVVLPCLCQTLKDITAYYEDKTLSREIRWRKMYHKMTEEAGGLPLPQRFVLYNHFLALLKQLLTRSPIFDLNTLENLRTRVLKLREQRGIPPPPTQAGPLVRQDLMSLAVIQEPNSHWAEQIFSLPLPSRTELRHLKPSKSYAPFYPWGHLSIPPDSKILFRRPFDNDLISIVVFLNLANQSPYYLMRTMKGDTPWFSLLGAHELCIEREGSALQLKRWSHSEQCSKLWAALYFLTWEEMVLFYCTFVALKARNMLTVQIHPNEFRLQREKRLFQAQIIDDGFRHSLIVYEDLQTQGLRLHAAVWEGELRQCPVWTAFVTHQSRSPTWLSRRSKHRVWLKDVQLYVFCNTYRQENMRQNKSGAFEIYFDRVEAAKRFRELFLVRLASPESSENEPVAGPSG
ncbi:DH domain-containing protein [Madurella fahalii]|uniref:DH domain-containing protein n=1 Tax=Madurella fahalii TaxID=1157608 RepID=A0ABQ0G0B2_9PEZI